MLISNFPLAGRTLWWNPIQHSAPSPSVLASFRVKNERPIVVRDIEGLCLINISNADRDYYIRSRLIITILALDGIGLVDADGAIQVLKEYSQINYALESNLDCEGTAVVE